MSTVSPTPLSLSSLSATDLAIVDRHLAAGVGDGVRVPQWDGAFSVTKDGRLWVHKDTPRKQAFQERVYCHSVRGIAPTLTCSHPLKFYDLRRYATPREVARVQGFPDSFQLPVRRVARLFGNAVAVPCARHACACVLDDTKSSSPPSPSPSPLSYLDVCAGIGGMSVALHQVAPQAVCVGYSEIFPAAIRCYEANFPNAPALGDARLVTHWPACDLVLLSIPCQSFSTCIPASRRALHPSRDLHEVALAAVARSGATRVVFENVPTMRATGKEAWTAFCDGLRALGFALDAHVLDARDFGLPQARKRLYLVGRRDSGVSPFSVSLSRKRQEEREDEGGSELPTLADVLEDEGW